MKNRTQLLKEKAEKELTNILDFWINESIDEQNGGFIGEINYKGEKNNHSEKEIMLPLRYLQSAQRILHFQEFFLSIFG